MEQICQIPCKYIGGNMRISHRLFAAILISIALISCKKAEDNAKTANLVYVNWEEGVAYTHLAKAVLEEKMGYTVNLTVSDVAPGFAAVASGDQDAFMETWLPVLHKDYIDRYKGKLVDLGHVFEGTESGLAVPMYMFNDGVKTISDLKKPEVAEKLDHTITGIDAGAGLMITTENDIMPDYGLKDAGYTLMPSSGPAMMAALQDAVNKKRYIVVIGWKPHSMFGMWDLAFLEQDKKKVWKVGNIHIHGRKNIKQDKPELAQFLSNMILNTEQVGSLMVAIRQSDKDIDGAVRDWMSKNEDVITPWIP